MQLFNVFNWKHYLVIVVTLVLFSKGLNNQFNSWDDTVYVTENPYLELNTNNLKHSFFEGETHGMYLPITALSFSINHHFSQYNPKAYLITNLIIHIINIILVFILIQKLFKNEWMTLIIGALFALHPMQAECVSYVAGRRDILYAVFYFASLISYINYIDLKQKKWRYYCLLFFIFSFLSKGQAISLPFVLLLIDLQKQIRFDWKKSIQEKWLYFVLSILFVAITLIVKQQSKEFNISGEIVDLPAIYKIGFAAYGFVFYIINLSTPYKLSLVHPYPYELEFTPALIASLVSVIVIMVFVIKKFKTEKIIVFGLLFYVFNIFLLLQLIPNSYGIMNDHYVYVSSIGVFIASYSIIIKFIKTEKTQLVVFLSITLVYAFLLISRIAVFKTSETVFTDVIKKYPNSYVAYTNRGFYYYNQGKMDLALADYNKGVESNPKAFKTYNNRALVYLNMQQYQLAENDFNKAIDLKPDFADAFSNRGIAKAMQGNKNAIEDFNKSVELNPNDYKIRFNRAGYFFQTNQLDKACADLQESKRLGLNKDTRKLDAACVGK
jgi:tetratricopeptide (TPR) repeat protein